MTESKSAPIAKAWIQLAPTLDGSERLIEKQLGGISTKAGRTASKSFGTGFTGGLKPVLAAGAAIFAGGAAVDFTKEAINQASDLNESLNAVQVIFGKNAQGVLDLGATAAGRLGLANVDFNALSVQFGSFAKTVAGKRGDVVGTMDDLTTRAADFASVMNIEVADAAALFQSGLAGESEPLRRYGLDLSAATVDQYAWANGIGKAGKQLTETQKVQARYGLLMKETAKVQGDFSNTSDQLANSQRILAAEWKDAQAELGVSLLPLMKDATRWLIDDGLPALTGFIDDLKDPSTTIGGLAQNLGNLWNDIQPSLTDAFQTGASWAGEFLSGASGAIDSFKAGGVDGLAEYWEKVFDPTKGIHDPLQAIGQTVTATATSLAQGTFWEDWKAGAGFGPKPPISQDEITLLAGKIDRLADVTSIDYKSAAWAQILAPHTVTADPTASWGNGTPVINVYVDTMVAATGSDLARKAQAEVRSNQTSGTRTTTKKTGSTSKRVT